MACLPYAQALHPKGSLPGVQTFDPKPVNKLSRISGLAPAHLGQKGADARHLEGVSQIATLGFEPHYQLHPNPQWWP